MIKNITTGEGGIVVTNNNKYANRIRLLRNHGEAVVGGKKKRIFLIYLVLILGWVR